MKESTSKLKKYRTYIIVLVGVVLLTQTFIFSMTPTKSSEKEMQNGEDERIASELSNMTGITTEEILKLKNTGVSWNDVIESLKGRNNNSSTSNDQFNQLINSNGLDKKYLEELRNKGISDDKIMDTKLLVERVVFQLQEIVQSNQNNDPTPTVDTNINMNKQEDLVEYKKILDNFNTDKSIYLAVTIENSFGSIEAVIDEYLFSLQFDLNLEDYLANKETYLKKKEDKNIDAMTTEVITLSKIESKMLEILSQENQVNKDDPNSSGLLKNETMSTNENSPLPEPSTPNVPEVTPKNPADEIMEEINQLNPNFNK